jgi:hypothetical protein
MVQATPRRGVQGSSSLQRLRCRLRPAARLALPSRLVAA